MKNLKLKILLFLITFSTVVTVLAFIENAKTIDILFAKNLSYRDSRVNEILEIQDIETRKAVGAKFLYQLDENQLQEQDNKATIFALLSFSVCLSIACILITLFEFRKRK